MISQCYRFLVNFSPIMHKSQQILAQSTTSLTHTCFVIYLYILLKCILRDTKLGPAKYLPATLLTKLNPERSVGEISKASWRVIFRPWRWFVFFLIRAQYRQLFVEKCRYLISERRTMQILISIFFLFSSFFPLLLLD